MFHLQWGVKESCLCSSIHQWDWSPSLVHMWDWSPSLVHMSFTSVVSSTTEVKDKFYDDLAATIKKIPEREPLFILGDFNARVGADHSSWPTCLGHFGIGKMNENGQCLLVFSCYYGLCVSNTFFNTKLQHSLLETSKIEALASARFDPV